VAKPLFFASKKVSFVSKALGQGIVETSPIGSPALKAELR
jgi:hypothetical protein